MCQMLLQILQRKENDVCHHLEWTGKMIRWN